MIGRIIGQGRFKITEPLGEGGCAIVYKGIQFNPATKTAIRDVAIKILAERFTKNENLVQRFRNEALTIAGFEHPNIVKIYDVGTEDDLHYFVMNLLHSSLRQVLTKTERLSLSKWVKIARDIASALDYAHKKHIIHRDIKPDNVMFDEHNNAVLTDFGIVKSKELTNLTQAGTIMGTPAYMSPEQIKGKDVDHQTDIYSFGIVLYEMLVGEAPFHGEDPIAVCHNHIHDLPVAPRTKNPDIPRNTERIILKAIEKSKDDRYKSADEMLKDLEKVVAIEEQQSDTSRPNVTQAIAFEGEGIREKLNNLKTKLRTQSKEFKRIRAAVAIMVAAVVLAGVFKYYNSRESNGDPVKQAGGNEIDSVTQPSPNHPPELENIDNKIVKEDEELTFTITSSDPDENVVTYRASDVPAGADFNAQTGNFSWRPGFDQSGDYRVRFEVSDGQLSDSQTISIAVKDVTLPIPTDTQPVEEESGYGRLVIGAKDKVGNIINANVWIDGKDYGYTPVEVDRLAVGSHTVKISKFPYGEKTMTANVREGKRDEVWFELEKENSSDN